MQIYILNPDGMTLCNMSNDNDSIKAFNFHDSKFTRYLNSAEVFEFSCPTGQHEDSKYIQIGNHVIFKYSDDYHLFTITEIEDDHAEAHTIKVYCEGASMLLLNSVIHPTKTDSQTPEQALNIALATTDWHVGRVEVYGNKNIEFNYETVLEGITSLCELYECDAQFRVEYTPQTGVTGKYVDLLGHIGGFKGHRFEYGVNVSNVTRKINSDNVVTAVIPIGKNDINITNIECEVSRHGFDKPQGISYVALAEEERAKIAQSPYHIFGTLKVDSEDPYTLATKAWEHLNENTEPKVEYSFNPAEMGFEAELGDDVYCIDRDLGLQLQARVSEKTVCFEDSSQDSITLINFEEKDSDINFELISQIQSQLKDLEIENNVVISDKMPTPETGKPITWVDTTPGADGKVTVQTWDGEQWLEHINGEYVNTTINQAKDEIKEEVTNEYTVYISKNTELPVYKQDTQPEHGIHNQLWLDTSKVPNVWKRYNESSGEWEKIITAGLDEDARVSISDTLSDLNSTKASLLTELENLKGEDSRIYQEIENTNEKLSSKMGKTEVETIVNGAIESLSGNGQNLIVYGACDDFPRMQESYAYELLHSEASIVGGALKVQPNGESRYCNYCLGSTTQNNGILKGWYTLSFDIKIPADSTCTLDNVNVNWNEGYYGYSSSPISSLNVVSTSGDYTRYSSSYEFTFDENDERWVDFEIDSGAGKDTNATILLDNIKLERGQEPTAFTKNPNEFTSAELASLRTRVTATETAIEQTNEKFSSYVGKATYEADKNGMNELISSQQTKIDQTAEALTAKLDSSTYTSDKNGILATLEDHSAKIDANAKQISSKVSMTEVNNAIDNLEFDGRNLAPTNKISGRIVDSSKESFNANGHEYTFTKRSDYSGVMIDLGHLEVGEVYTLSYKIQKVSGVLENIGFHAGRLVGTASRKIFVNGNDLTSQFIDNLYNVPDDDTVYTVAFTAKCGELEAVNPYSLCIQANRGVSSEIVYKVWDIKLETGNKATGWTPAPEDVYSTENRITTAESNIIQQADLISSKVTKTEMQSNLDNAISNIKVGGRNYALGTSASKAKVGQNKENDTMTLYNFSSALISDCNKKQVTVSFEYTISGSSPGGKFRLQTTGGSTYRILSSVIPISETGTFKHINTTSFGDNSNNGFTAVGIRLDNVPTTCTVTISNLKVEEGNKSTTWTPAPEDVDSSLSSLGTRMTTAESTITQQANLIASKVTQSEIDSAIENLEIGGRNLVLQSKLDANYKNSAWGCTHSGTYSYSNGFLEIKKESTTDRLFFYQSVSKNSLLKSIPEAGNNVNWTISADVKAISGQVVPSGSTIQARFYFTDETYYDFSMNIPTNLSTSKWTRIDHTSQFIGVTKEFNYDNCGVSIALGSGAGGLAVRNIKLEKGNKATAWTPAPEDAEMRITTAESTIEQHADMIEQRVIKTTYETDKNSLTSRIDSAESRITQTEKDITQRVTSTDFNALGSRVSTAEGRISTMQDQISLKVGSSEFTPIKEKVDNLKVGGRNLISTAWVRAYSVSSSKYDARTNTWELTAQPNASGSWGAGLELFGKNILIPFGQTYCLSFEIKVPRACQWNIDVNNYAVTGDSWGGNDNDAIERTTSSKELEANKWIKCWSVIKNTHSKNTSKVDIYDVSHFGVKMDVETTEITFKIRNVKGELGSIPTDWTPYEADTVIGGTNLIRNSHFNEGLSGWGCSDVNSIDLLSSGGHDGGKCLKITGGAGKNNYVGQTEIKLEPDTIYTFSGWYKSDNAVLGTTNPFVRYYLSFRLDGTYKSEVQLTDNITGTNAWTKVSYTFKTPSASVANDYFFAMYARDFTGSVYYDGIKIEKGNNCSDWSPHPEDKNASLVDLETRVQAAEIKLTDDSIVSTVTSSSMFEVLMNKKADSSELGSFATLEELDSKLSGMDITGTIDERVAEMITDGSSKLNLQFSTKAELNQTATSINQNISMANGLNFLKNSGLHADWGNWTKWGGGGITIKDCPELSKYGIGKCFSFSAVTVTSGSTADNRGVYQDFQTEVGKTYTFSAYLKKTNKGTEGSGFDYTQLTMEARNGSSTLGAIKVATIADSRVTDGYEIITVIGVAKSATTRVGISGRGNFTGSWAGFMCHEGSIPLKWTLASGEMYNTNVQTDINGIKVMRRDSNSNITGYTSITPDEFAGYYDTDGDGTMEKVFYLNDDETVTKKVRATNEITMGSIKVVNVGSGWAFVKTT